MVSNNHYLQFFGEKQRKRSKIWCAILQVSRNFLKFTGHFVKHAVVGQPPHQKQGT